MSLGKRSNLFLSSTFISSAIRVQKEGRCRERERRSPACRSPDMKNGRDFIFLTNTCCSSSREKPQREFTSDLYLEIDCVFDVTSENRYFVDEVNAAKKDKWFDIPWVMLKCRDNILIFKP